MIPFEREPKRDKGPEPGRSQSRLDGRIGRGPVDPAASASARIARSSSYAGWLVGPLILCSIAAAMLFVVRGPDTAFAVAFGLVLTLGLLWILISALLPARADRRCPACGRSSVVRIDARSLTGLRCRSCTWRDESASAFVHAEDEGAPLEDIVLRERGRFRRL